MSEPMNTWAAPGEPDAVAEGSNASTPTARRKRRWWLRLPIYALLAYGLWLTALYFGQEQMLFPRGAVRTLSREELKWTVGGFPLFRNLEDGARVEAWFLPADDAGPEHPAPLVVFFHGNAEAIDNLEWFVQRYRALGCSILLPEYRGYGRSGGTPSEAGIVADAAYFYDQIVQRPEVDRRRVVFHGRSLGGGVAAQVAARRQPTALILESTFTSVAVMAHRYLAPMWLARNPFRTDQVLPQLDIPVLIAHGNADGVIPVEHGRRLSQLAKRATYLEYNCGHDNLPPPRKEVQHWRQIEAFLRDSGVLEGSSGS